MSCAPTVPNWCSRRCRNRNRFRDAQNVAELIGLWSLSTEEPPGDGEAPAGQLNRWLRDLSVERDARLAELKAAGVVSQNLNFRR